MGDRFLIGLGNYSMGDDGVGLRIVEHVVEKKLDKGFTALDLGGRTLSLIDWLSEATEAVVIVDAVRSGRKPGDFVLFSPGDVRSEKALGGFSTHEEDVLKTIELARALGYPVPSIRILGIEPASMKAGDGLSAELEGRFSEYVAAAIREITSSMSV